MSFPYLFLLRPGRIWSRHHSHHLHHKFESREMSTSEEPTVAAAVPVAEEPKKEEEAVVNGDAAGAAESAAKKKRNRRKKKKAAAGGAAARTLACPPPGLKNRLVFVSFFLSPFAINRSFHISPLLQPEKKKRKVRMEARRVHLQPPLRPKMLPPRREVP